MQPELKEAAALCRLAVLWNVVEALILNLWLKTMLSGKIFLVEFSPGSLVKEVAAVFSVFIVFNQFVDS